jgi:hypothetical protein
LQSISASIEGQFALKHCKTASQHFANSTGFVDGNDAYVAPMRSIHRCWSSETRGDIFAYRFNGILEISHPSRKLATVCADCDI